MIFNDYMNTLMGDPTTERLLPLIDAAAAVGAEYFCIDAGWYADLDESWWDTVGEWKPSRDPVPRRASPRCSTASEPAGMVPGLWLEPEVVGVSSPVADAAAAPRRSSSAAGSWSSSTAATTWTCGTPRP